MDHFSAETQIEGMVTEGETEFFFFFPAESARPFPLFPPRFWAHAQAPSLVLGVSTRHRASFATEIACHALQAKRTFW